MFADLADRLMEREYATAIWEFITYDTFIKIHQVFWPFKTHITCLSIDLVKGRCEKLHIEKRNKEKGADNDADQNDDVDHVEDHDDNDGGKTQNKMYYVDKRSLIKNKKGFKMNHFIKYKENREGKNIGIGE